ncbi:uncharacterized protein PpBr36_10177 [Pyricularia pennisetigena]|uniref:uncharacterized protein n=1 Tax=Pyricularia pennisetigena TaxID=1578925 RepID=UPI00114E1AE5|nr:uncharacterized protein PpBr36_10177 [Pyricularia pennisetigena]TLS21570.1 hypothetical protein PpBr36_10177 [Pyricularia pennisetigena]
MRVVVAHHDAEHCAAPNQKTLDPHEKGLGSVPQPVARNGSAPPALDTLSTCPSTRGLTTPLWLPTSFGAAGVVPPPSGPGGLMDEQTQKAACKRREEFRDMALSASNRCVVTGLGKLWCLNPTVGPGIHVAHIVPQLQYHVYPLQNYMAFRALPSSLYRTVGSRTNPAHVGLDAHVVY